MALNEKKFFHKEGSPKIILHKGDLSQDVSFLDPAFKGAIAVDTEAMGLRTGRDRLCLVQISEGNGTCHLVQFSPDHQVGKTRKQLLFKAPNLKRVLENRNILKIFHFARFDVATLYCYLGATVRPLFCTKIASKLTRTFTDRHGLKDLCKTYLKIDISKEEQTSDWGAESLTQSQLTYAATDVLYLHALKEELEELLRREDRLEIAQACFSFLTTLAKLDCQGFGDDVLKY